MLFLYGKIFKGKHKHKELAEMMLYERRLYECLEL